MYSIVPCSKSYESRFFIFIQLWAENVIERGICWEKNVFLCHFKVIQGQSMSFGFIILYPYWLSCGQKWWEYENVLQRYDHICSQLGNLGPFGPTVKLNGIWRCWFTCAVLRSIHFLTHLYIFLLLISFAYFWSFSWTSDSRASASWCYVYIKCPSFRQVTWCVLLSSGSAIIFVVILRNVLRTFLRIR